MFRVLNREACGEILGVVFFVLFYFLVFWNERIKERFDVGRRWGYGGVL